MNHKTDKKKSKAVFLDRDGVINDLLFHREMGIIESPFTTGQFRLRPGVAKAIRKINQMGFKAVVVSNQPGIAMKNFSNKTLQDITRKMIHLLKKEGAYLDAIYYCVHHPTKGKGPLKRKCSCRKPKPGMLKRAAKDLNLSLGRSYLVGDSILDVQAGLRAGTTTLLLAHLKCDLCHLMAKKKIRPHHIVKDLRGAVKEIQKQERR